MKYQLESNITNVMLPGVPRPEGTAIYAIPFVQGEVLDGRWLPEGTIVEDPGSQLVQDSTARLPKNPLKVILPGDRIVDHPDDGEIFRLDGGELAAVFNHRRGIVR